MLASFIDFDLTQKQLYFKLNNALLLEHTPELTKLSGVYAIYSSNICLYVGQSKNLASRIATHMKGKYDLKELSIFIFLPYDYYETFTELDVSDQSLILLKNESYLIKKLKPVENIIADHSIEIDKDFAFTSIIEDSWPEMEIYRHRSSYLISDTEPDINGLLTSKHSIINDWIQEHEQIKKHFEKEAANENN